MATRVRNWKAPSLAELNRARRERRERAMSHNSSDDSCTQQTAETVETEGTHSSLDNYVSDQDEDRHAITFNAELSNSLAAFQQSMINNPQQQHTELQISTREERFNERREQYAARYKQRHISDRRYREPQYIEERTFTPEQQYPQERQSVGMAQYAEQQHYVETQQYTEEPRDNQQYQHAEAYEQYAEDPRYTQQYQTAEAQYYPQEDPLSESPLPRKSYTKQPFSKARKNPAWMKMILSPHLPGASQEEMDALFRKPHPQESYPTRAELAILAQRPRQQEICTRKEDFTFKKPQPQKTFSRTASPSEDSHFNSKSIEVSRSPAVRFPRTYLDEIADAEAEAENMPLDEEPEEYTDDLGKNMEAEEYTSDLGADMEVDSTLLVAKTHLKDEDMTNESVQSKASVESIAAVEFVATTPRVTGAYIETPAPLRQYQADTPITISPLKQHSRSKSPLPTISNSVQQSRPDSPLPTTSKSMRHPRPDSPLPTTSKPTLPLVINTAITYSADEEVRQLEIAAGLSDSPKDDTLERFAAVKEEIPTSPTVMDRLDSLFFDAEGLPLSVEQRAQKLEMLYYERMNKRLLNHSSSLRATTRGIGRITEKLATLPDAPPSEVLLKAGEISTSENSDHSYLENIVQINKHSGGAKINFSIKSDAVEIDLKFKINLARLFWKSPEQSPDRTRGFWRNLTWMGIFCLVALVGIVYCCGDYGASYIFSRPEYSTTNNWSYDDPEFPFVIVTKTQRILSAIFRDVVGGGGTGSGSMRGHIMNRTISMDEIVG